VSALCLLALSGALLWRSEAPAITLRWIHSVEKTVWEEVWQPAAGHLVLLEARIEGSGAGMEPPPEARRLGRFFVWAPMQRFDRVDLAQSGAAGTWTICDPQGCFAPLEAFAMVPC